MKSLDQARPKHLLIRQLHTPKNENPRRPVKQRSVNQFEEADPTSKDRKIIKMRNVVDLGDNFEENRKTSARKRNTEDNLDLQLLEQLDQWHENMVSNRKTFAFEQMKPSDNSKGQQIDSEFTSESGPHINQAIINQIMKPIEKAAVKVEEDQEDQVQVKFQMLRLNKDPSNNVLKTLDQVRIEMNKQIMNSLLLQKVTKKLDEMQINRKVKSHWNIQKMDEETTQVFREQMQTLKTKTLNNFKGLTEYFSNPAQYIDYDVVLTKAKHHSNRPPTSFPQTLIPQGQQTLQSAKQLMESYQQFQCQIREHKQVLFQMRIDNNALVQEVNRKEEEISDIKRRYYIKEEKARQGWIPEQPQEGGQMRKRNLMETIDKLKQAKDSEIRGKMKEVQSLKKQITENNDKQTQIQKELDELRQKKHRCKMLLKDIYLKQFNEANFSLVNDGLISVIKNMHKINEKAKAEQFPKYLSEESKQYLLQAANLEIQIEETRAQAQMINMTQLHLKSNPSKASLFGYQESVSEIKNKVKQLLKKSKVSIKKPVYVQGIDPLNPSQFAHVIKWENQDLEQMNVLEHIEGTFKQTNLPTEQNQNIKDYNKALVSLQQELENLQNTEAQRILKLYQNKKHMSDVQELKLILYALFGQLQGDQYWYSFVQEWTEQKSVDPKKILKQQDEKNEQNERGTLAKMPKKMKQKINETFKKLTQVTNLDYQFDLLKLNE